MDEPADSKSLLSTLKDLNTSIGKLPEMVKSFVNVRDAIKLQNLERTYNAEIIRILSIMLDAQQKGIEMNNKYLELYREANELRAQLSKRDEYALREVAAGVFCFVTKEPVVSYSNARKLCTNCYEKGTYSTLISRRAHAISDDNWTLECSNCGFSQSFSEFKSV